MLNETNIIISKYKLALTNPYFLKTACPLFKQFETSIHAKIVLKKKNSIHKCLQFKFNAIDTILCLRKYVTLPQNREDVVSHPRKNNDRYLILYNKLGKELKYNKYTEI